MHLFPILLCLEKQWRLLGTFCIGSGRSKFSREPRLNGPMHGQNGPWAQETHGPTHSKWTCIVVTIRSVAL